MTHPAWLHVIGIGEDGVEGLSEVAQALIAAAELVVGGRRHLLLVEGLMRGERLMWPTSISEGIERMLRWRGRRVVVLASGDPFSFGIGVTLCRYIPVGEMTCIPAPSSITLACARMGWARQDTTVLSICGRPMEVVAPALQPGAHLIVLSADGRSPVTLAKWMTARGFGPSVIHVLEALGGPYERHVHMRADALAAGTAEGINPLNLMGIEVVAEPGAMVLPLSTGLPDDMFAHDGQITKREIRAATLSALAPRQGEMLWDIGGGAGSIAIEWMLCHPANRAVTIERNRERTARIAHNALTLGTPALRIVEGSALETLAALHDRQTPRPDAVFVGGGIGNPGMMEGAWDALRPGGRLVANAVTLEGETALLAAHARWGGSLSRLRVERVEQVGTQSAFRPAMTVTQYAATRPAA
ncbi:precorrin-6y C5,15-methyltransferase (decarboxylating) subunit CbiE [Komagataeibacter sp. FNDCR1]|nr:precorrin-6y C5,15-methyltransferase (decarboxylating) subunit CbiE [Komagataeibacter sp. FNDCR1]